MKIMIISGEVTKAEARGVIALLMEIHGADVVPAAGRKIGMVPELGMGFGPAVTNQVSDTPAADGYPTPDLNEGADDPDVAKRFPMPPAPAGALDSAGIPWDERIHSSTKGTNKDGTWSRRRNTPDDLFATVMAELKARATTAAPAVPPPPAEPTAADAFAPPPPPPVNPSDEGTRTTGPAVIPPPPIVPPVTGGAPTFVQLMTVVTGAQREGKLDKAKLDELLASCGIAGLGKLATADEGTRAAFDAVLTAALA